jgi:hypothetical protein
MAVDRDGWGLATMGAMAMGRVSGGVSAQWGVRTIKHNGWGLAAMGAMAMGRVGSGASA